MPRDPEPNATRVYSHAEKMRVITGIILCILLTAIDQTVVLPAIPQMEVSLHGGAHLSWVVSAFLLTTTATTPVYGKLSDQLGRRAVLIPALIIFMAASVFCALANSVPMLILGRALQGVGGGALLAVSQAAVADVVSPRERGKYQAWFAGTWAVASIAGPVAGGFVTEHLSWRVIFWSNIPVCLAAILLCARGLAGLPKAGGRGRIDYLGALLMVTSVTALLAGLSTGGIDFAWLSLPEAAFFSTGILLALILTWQQGRAEEPLMPGALIRTKIFRQVLSISFLNSAAMFSAIFLLPLMLQWVFHATPAASGLALVPFLATTVVGAYTSGQITRRTGRTRPVMVVALLTSAISFLPLAALPAEQNILWPIIVGGLFGFGIGAVMPSSLVASQSQAARRDVGAATGTLLLLRALGGAFGATIAGTELSLLHGNLLSGFHLGFAVCAALETLAALTAWQMADIPLRENTEPEMSAPAH
jgi:EmrB/QacA subfamily drug resistance transporter